MPRYAVLIYHATETQPVWGSPEFQKVAQEWGAFNKEIEAAGIMTANAGLQPTSTSTTVRVRDGKTLTTDGPFAETREQLGGILVLDCKDLDEAIGWAARIPSARDGSIEIRPLWQPQQ